MATSLSHVQSPSTSRPSSSRPGSSSSRYTPVGSLAGNDLGKSLAYVPPISEKDCMEELREVLRKPLENVSRQRLRAILYGFRRKGGLENRISVQHMNSVLLEHEVRLSSRITQLIRKGFEGKYGIDYESLWKLMCGSQALSGRDSVICLYGEDIFPGSRKQSVSGTVMDPRDRELIDRLKHQLMSSRDHNLAEIRSICEEKDTLRHGILPVRVLRKICEEQRLPVSKSLLSVLLARCDDEKNGQVSWTDLLGLLEKASSEVPTSEEVSTLPPLTKSRPTSVSKTAKNQLSSINEKSSAPSSKGRVINKPTAGKKATKEKKTTVPPAASTEDLSEMDPFNASYASSLSKNSSSSEDSLALSWSVGKNGKTVEEGDVQSQEIQQEAHMTEELVAGDVSKAGIGEGKSSGSSLKNEPNNKSKEDLNGHVVTSSRPPSGAKNKSSEEDKNNSKLRPLSGLADKIKSKVNIKKVKVKSETTDEDKKEIAEDVNATEKGKQEMGGVSEGLVEEDSKGDLKKAGIVAAEVMTEASSSDGASHRETEVEEHAVDVEDKSQVGNTQEVNQTEEVQNNNEIKTKESQPESVEYQACGKNLTFYVPDAFSGFEGPKNAPEQTLKLDWVYGYQGNDCRNNLYSLSTGELVYFSANIIILYDPLEHKQRHYLQHDGAVKSLAVHFNGTSVASGQEGNGSAEASVHIWNSSSLQTLLVLKDDVFQKGVTCLDFASSDGYLLTVDGGSHPTLSVWDWKNGEKFASVTINTDVICQVRFQPKDPAAIVSVGKEHMAFWNFDKEESKLEEKSKANFERNMKAKYITCLTFRSNGDIVTGDSNGTVYIWPRKGNTISHVLSHIHEGPVFALQFLRGLLLTGGRDGKLQAWTLGSKGGQPMCTCKLVAKAGGVRMLAVAGSRIFLGTTMNCIMSISITPSGPPFEASSKMDVVTEGHYDEVNGLSVFTKQSQSFVTVGYDGVITLVNGENHQPVWRHWLKSINLLCVDTSENGELLAVGTREASLLVLSMSDAAGCQVLTKQSVSEAGPVVCVKFSPDGKRLVTANDKGSIQIFQILKSGKELKLGHILKGHKGSVKSLDWSSDGHYLRSSAENGEFFVWNMKTNEKVETLEEVRNLNWRSYQTLHGFHLKGLWNPDSPIPKAVDVTNQKPFLIVSAEDPGMLGLHHYPSYQTDYKQSVRVGSDVSNVRFLHQGGHVISVGGKSCCTLQWTIEPVAEESTLQNQ